MNDSIARESQALIAFSINPLALHGNRFSEWCHASLEIFVAVHEKRQKERATERDNVVVEMTPTRNIGTDWPGYSWRYTPRWRRPINVR